MPFFMKELQDTSHPWLGAIIIPPPAAADPPLTVKRLRPLIYIYDLPAKYNARLLQYRNEISSCVYRRFGEDNSTLFTENTYSIETLLHEMLLQSPYRTLDPEEADFFYAPVYTSCFSSPVFAWADHPWYYGPSLNRVQHMAMMALEAKRWVENHHPWWKRRGGADHIWLFTHDEAPCWVPHEIYNHSIILSHWGRKDSNPKSNTAYPADDYSDKKMDAGPFAREGWMHVIGGHTCFEPHLGKDLIIPAFKNPGGIGRSPLLGYAAQDRTTLLFFRGDFRDGVLQETSSRYSRNIRQRLRELARKERWKEKYNILIGTRDEVPGKYDELLSSSIFCLVTPGDGWSPRAEDAILHGCIPLLIQDDVDPCFSTVLDWDAFSVRIAEKDLEEVPRTLSSISEARVREMQIALSKVWHRFMYVSATAFGEPTRKMVQTIRHITEEQRANGTAPTDSFLPEPYSGDFQDDAFSTIIAWLGHKALQREGNATHSVQYL